MAKLRKWTAYRKLERPYTRFSKFRKKGFVKSRPGKSIIKFDMGDLENGPKYFPIKLELIAKESAQLRANSIEAARISILRRIEKKYGRKGFYMKIKAYPHHVIRENPLAAGAGADRLSTGMKHSFGKTIGTAAQITTGKVLLELHLAEGQELFGRNAIRIGASKISIKTTIQATYKKVKELSEEELMYQKADEAKYALKDAKSQLVEAQEAQQKATTEEEKVSAAEKLSMAQRNLETAEHIKEIEDENLEKYEEEHTK
jgi:large subunit ribosomal protein L10e